MPGWTPNPTLTPQACTSLIRWGESLTEEPTSRSQSLLIARNLSKGNVIVASGVIWAGTSAERRRGLLGRDFLSPDEGIYIVPCEWIHTFGMRFPIDVAFLHRDGRVLSIHHALKPNRLSKLILRADGVLELAAGKLEETRTSVGDVIIFEDD